MLLGLLIITGMVFILVYEVADVSRKEDFMLFMFLFGYVHILLGEEGILERVEVCYVS